MRNLFSEQHLAGLREEYSKIQRINPTGETWQKLERFMQSLPVHLLRQLEQADIKWVSGLARLNLVSAGML